MLGAFAEFQTNLRRERQLGGTASAKARGVYKGRKASIDPVPFADGLRGRRPPLAGEGKIFWKDLPRGAAR
jgi:DNA invertase Pin-like site-specific DNA recombinase